VTNKIIPKVYEICNNKNKKYNILTKLDYKKNLQKEYNILVLQDASIVP